jgi:hypothetical protein
MEAAMQKLNQGEAPPGYYAVLKSEAKPRDGSNICRACDWRSECSGEKYRCMPFEVVTPDGRILKREDQCSVVFKKKREQLYLFET